MAKSFTAYDESLFQYCLDNSLRETKTLQALREETDTQEMAIMQISPDQGQFMAFLVKLINAKKIIEIGTFTGYSALVMALATEDGAQIDCCDISEEWTSIGKKYWIEGGVENKIQLHLAPAIDTLNEFLPDRENSYDMAFIDADKVNYDFYFESCLSLLRPGGVLLIDNVFWGGDVADLEKQDDDTNAIRKLNKKLHRDDRFDLSMIAVGDGLTLVRKR